MYLQSHQMMLQDYLL